MQISLDMFISLKSNYEKKKSYLLLLKQQRKQYLKIIIIIFYSNLITIFDFNLCWNLSACWTSEWDRFECALYLLALCLLWI